MSTLLLRLAGPMQSWGVKGRFTRRTTELEPTKSGIVGLLAAALGRRRTDPIEDLANLTMGMRVEQPGKLNRDFQTATQGRVSAPLSYRYYLSDAVFLTAIEGPKDFVETLSNAVNNPAFPLYLGRRAFPPAGQPHRGMHAESAYELLHSTPWTASPLVMEKNSATAVKLRVVRDIQEGEPPTSTMEDLPVSFDPNRRLYATRQVTEEWAEVSNPRASAGNATTQPAQAESVQDKHDPFGYLGGQIVS